MATQDIEKKIWKRLSNVMDPEMYISIVDLGLIYGITYKDAHARISMTLTTLGCPLFPTIERDVKNEVGKIRMIKKVSIDLTFDPPWSIDRMSEKGKAELGV